MSTQVEKPKWPPPTIDEIAERLYCRIERNDRGGANTARLIPLGPTFYLDISDVGKKDFEALENRIKSEGLFLVGIGYGGLPIKPLSIAVRGPQVDIRSTRLGLSFVPKV